MGNSVIELANLDRNSSWKDLKVVVLGIGTAGFACADALLRMQCKVLVLDQSSSKSAQERAQILETLGAEVRLNTTNFAEADLVVTSPGVPPNHPWLAEAKAKGISIWGELELAWRLRDPLVPWLLITGTNGKTTTTLMTKAILKAAGLKAKAIGNIGFAAVDAVMDEEVHDVFVVEVGVQQLPFVYSISPLASVVLNVAEDHLDHVGNFEEYKALKAKIYERTVVAAIYNDQDEETRLMVEGADVVEGCRAIGFTLNIPGRSMVGVVDDLIVDRAFIVERGTNAQELANTNDVQPFARHNLSNALAATALARAFGVPGAAVRDGLRNFVPAKHRISLVLEKEGIKYIDDSKATNAHAASQSLLSYESVIWIGGGDAKGQDLAEFVKQTSSRIKAAIVMGQDRRMIIDSLKGMNSVLPITEIIETNPEEAMRIAVEAAVSYASNGDVVLLAPGCASWDMFKDYGHRGDSFSEWVKKLV